MIFSQLENPVQNAGEDISDNVSDYAEKMMNETDENKRVNDIREKAMGKISIISNISSKKHAELHFV